MSTADLAPDRAEIARRLAAAARQAAGQGLDALVVLEPANVSYLSGFRTTLHTRFTAVALRAEAPEQALLIAPSVDRRLALEPIWCVVRKPYLRRSCAMPPRDSTRAAGLPSAPVV